MKIKDFDITQLKPNTKYILAVDQTLTNKQFVAFKKELDKWLKGTEVSEDSFLFIMNATVVELPTRPKKKTKAKIGSDVLPGQMELPLEPSK